MSHDVYICYDEKDKKAGDAICNMFEENDISSWIKSRDMSSSDSADTIINSIEDSKCFVLVYSKNSKDTNYIITETDIAFSRNIPILVFNIDGTKIGRNLEFILETQPMIYSFPNLKNQLETLVKKTRSIIGKPEGDVKIAIKYLRAFEKINPDRKEYTFKSIIKIAIPIAIVLILVYFFVIMPTGQQTTEDGVFAMNITDVDVSGSGGSYKYTVHGESYNMPSDSANYLMNIKFMDDKDKLVFEINSTADEFKSGVIGSCELDNNDVDHIDFKLMDLNGKVISQEKYAIK